MKRIHMHWTGGGHKANATDKKHYHVLIEGDGNVVMGNHAIEANIPPLKRGRYAAHTAKANSYAIGVAVCAMRGAKERPFDAGPSPITQTQFGVMIKVVADLCREYQIPVTRETVLTHAEVQPTLNIKQNAKWDIAWRPGLKGVRDPIAVGDSIRRLIMEEMRPRPTPPAPRRPPPPPPAREAPEGGVWQALLALLRAIADLISGRKRK